MTCENNNAEQVNNAYINQKFKECWTPSSVHHDKMYGFVSMQQFPHVK